MYANGKWDLLKPFHEWGMGNKGEWWRGITQLWYNWYIVRTFVNDTMYPHPTQFLKSNIKLTKLFSLSLHPFLLFFLPALPHLVPPSPLSSFIKKLHPVISEKNYTIIVYLHVFSTYYVQGNRVIWFHPCRFQEKIQSYPHVIEETALEEASTICPDKRPGKWLDTHQAQLSVEFRPHGACPALPTEVGSELSYYLRQ
jgi:hypothetical protein